MAADAWKIFANANELIGESIDLSADTFRMVLVTAAWTPNQTTNAVWSDISANEVANGNGYATHGKLLTATHARAGLVSTFDSDDQVWGGSTITAKYAVIVKDGNADGSLAAGDIPICYSDLENGGGSLSSVSGNFAVTINASGVFTRTAS